MTGIEHHYFVRRQYARKIWLGPRCGQLVRRLECFVRGHLWNAWICDDYDGPGEKLEYGGFMPYLLRMSAPGEFGIRACRNDCGAIETRYPMHSTPSLFEGEPRTGEG